MIWNQEARRKFGDSEVTTGFSATTKAEGWWNHKISWNGFASSKWLGNSPSFNADSMSQSTKFWVNAWGVNNFSLSISENPSLGISIQKEDVSQTVTHSVEDKWKIRYYFDNVVNTGWWFYVGLRTKASFQFGSNTFVDVTSDGQNNVLDTRIYTEL